jgi:hypothetical protein
MRTVLLIGLILIAEPLRIQAGMSSLVNYAHFILASLMILICVDIIELKNNLEK